MFVYTETRDNWVCLVHVDDVITAAVANKTLDQFGANLGAHFKVKDFGNVKYYLGLHFDQ